jgi:predicted nuclease with TOPRIM domain
MSEKQQSGEVVESIEGIQSVADQLTLKETTSRSQQRVQTGEQSSQRPSLTGSDIDSMKDRVIQLQGKVDEFRANNIVLMKERDGLMERLASVEGEAAKVSKDRVILEEEFNRVKGEYEGSIGLLSSSVSELSMRFNDILVQNVVKDVALKEGVIPSALEDVILRAKNVVKVVDNERVIVYNKEKDREVGIDDWVGNLKKTAPHLFYQSTGGGARGNVGSAVSDDSTMNSVQKILAGLSKLGA